MTRAEKLELLLQELRENKNTKIVEGSKDKKALESLGITNVITCSKSPQQAAGKASDPAVILTDYDRTGRRLASLLVELLHDLGKTADLSYRRRLRKLSEITRIEELPKKIEKIRRGEACGKNVC